MADETHERGLEIRGTVLGRESTDATRGGADEFDLPLPNLGFRGAREALAERETAAAGAPS
jgi:hypothetical protein